MANYKFLNLSNCLHYFDAKSNFFSYVYLFYLFLTFLEIGQNLPSDLTGQTSPVGLKKSNISTYKTYYVLIKCVRIMFLNLSTVRITCCYSIMFRKEVVLCPPFQDPKRWTHSVCFPLTLIPIRTPQLQKILDAAPESIYHQNYQNIKWFLAEEESCIKTLCTVYQLRGAGKSKNTIKGSKKYHCYDWNVTHSNPPPVDLVQNIFILFKQHFTYSFIRVICMTVGENIPSEINDVK